MKPSVQFVGAGPGAEDLITVRGLRALEQADLVVYAGSLVNPGHLRSCKPGCRCLDSAAMTLDEQVEAMSRAALSGRRVVRLHTGDPAVYGAINEQIRALAEKGVASSIVPGVSLLLCSIPMFFYKIAGKKKADMLSALEEKRKNSGIVIE